MDIFLIAANCAYLFVFFFFFFLIYNEFSNKKKTNIHFIHFLDSFKFIKLGRLDQMLLMIQFYVMFYDYDYVVMELLC